MPATRLVARSIAGPAKPAVARASRADLLYRVCMRARGPGARVRWTSPAALLAAAVAAVIGAISAPGDVRAESTVDVDVGVNGQTKLGAHAVMRITVRADVLIDGDVEVVADRSTMSTRVPIQVPAGTTKELLLVVPTGDGARFEVEVRDGDDVVATGRGQQRTQDDVELVGVLPRLTARVDGVPEQAALGEGLGRAELVPLTTDVIDLGPVALEGFDTLIGAGADLAALSEPQLRAVLLWVNTGGRLLLDDAESLNLLPEPWRPTADEVYAWAGRGEVRLLAGAASSGEWAEVIEPSPSASDRLDAGGDIFIDPQSSLAEQAGVRLPSLTPLMVVLAAYGLVVGPLVYLALRRARRLTLGWLVVPILAVVTAGGVVTGGGRFRSEGHPATSTFVDISPAGALALSNVLTFSRSGGDASVTLPAGWHPDGSTSMFFGPPSSSTSSTLVPASDGRTRLDQRLEAGQVTTNAFTGELAATSVGLTMTAELTADGNIAGTVTNTSGGALRDVAVFAGGGAEDIGVLEPGRSAEWSVNAPLDVPQFVAPAGEVWAPPFDQFGERGASDQLVDFGIYGAASLKWELYPTGIARAVGWTDEVIAPVDPGDGATARVGVSTTTPIESGGLPPQAAIVRAAIVRTPFGPNGDGSGDEQIYRYVLAPGTDAADGLVLADGVRDDGVSFWDGSDWIEGRQRDAEVPVPEAALRDGVVLVRTDVDPFGDPGVIPTLRAAEQS